MSINNVILGPGQASQYVGMGLSFRSADFPFIENYLQKAQQISNIPIADPAYKGPEELLTRTDNAQVCLTFVSICAYEILKRNKKLTPGMAAGHSLGEYVALYAAGVFDFEQVIKAVSIRGQAMHEAAGKCRGGMIAVMGLALNSLREIVDELSKRGVITIANINSPKQVILSGDKALLNEAGEKAKAIGALKVVSLNVSGPWHSEYMRPACDTMNDFFATIQLNKPQFPVYANLTAEPYPEDPEQIKKMLVEQIISPVRWVEIIEKIQARQPKLFIELSPGKVLNGILRQIDKSIKCISFDSIDQLNEIPD